MTNTMVGYCYSCLVVISQMKIQSLKKSTQVSQLKFSTQSLRITAVSVKLNSLPLNVPAQITHNDKHHQKMHTRGVWAVVKQPFYAQTGLARM